MARVIPSKAPSLELIVWANIKKWQMIRGVDDEQISAVLNIKGMFDRRKSLFLTVEEMGRLCAYLAIEPERLLER